MHARYIFGIVKENYTLKLAQKAYKTLSALCSTGSATPKLRVEANIYTATWIIPDAKAVISSASIYLIF